MMVREMEKLHTFLIMMDMKFLKMEKKKVMMDGDLAKQNN